MKKLIILAAVFTVHYTIIASPVKSTDDYNLKIYWKAQATFAESDFKQSLLLFTYLLDQDPNNTELNAYVGLCYKCLGKEKVANLFLEKVRSDPSMYFRLKIENFRLAYFDNSL